MITNFWLNRWKNNYEILRLKAFLNVLELERGDIVELDLSGHYSDQPADVLSIDTQPGSGVDNSIDEMNLILRLPLYAGCTTKCEMACETGCEDACELTDCQTFCQESCEQTACESDCQESCEQFCTSTCELTCVTDCEAQCQAGCESGCQAECELACLLSEEQCTLACEFICVVGCETSCQSGCQTACEVGCESDCTTMCEYGCQSDCQNSCQYDCQSEGCQLGCENTGCQTACEYDCETNCQSDCQLTCQLTCQNDCQSDAQGEVDLFWSVDYNDSNTFTAVDGLITIPFGVGTSPFVDMNGDEVNVTNVMTEGDYYKMEIQVMNAQPQQLKSTETLFAFTWQVIGSTLYVRVDDAGHSNNYTHTLTLMGVRTND